MCTYWVATSGGSPKGQARDQTNARLKYIGWNQLLGINCFALQICFSNCFALQICSSGADLLAYIDITHGLWLAWIKRLNK